MRKRTIAALLALMLVFASLSAVWAEGTETSSDNDPIGEMDAEMFGEEAVVERDGKGDPVAVNGYPVRKVRAGLNLRASKETSEFEIWFADYPFYREATEYDGNLAVMSLAMALSAKRAPNNGEPDASFDPSLNLKRYLAEAGFSNIRQDDYSKETSMYTISTAMGTRKMEREGEEPFTLIAIGVCGGGYKNEWQSNMTPGTGDVHEGFMSAAQLVIDRLSGYILTNSIEGEIKIWISGFSRAAAVSNLTAGFLVQKGIFEKEDVYAYTFATPAAVLDPPETGYENIFNILNPMDLVPQVMPADWRFGRYGKDLFLPVTEFSSIGEVFTDYRAEKAREMYGIETNYSPALNLRMRLLLSMILELMESREHYNERFQPAVVGLMQNKDAATLLANLRDLMQPLAGSGRESRENLDELIDYVVRVFGNVLTRTELAGANQNSGNPFLRLFNEHSEDTYLASLDTIRGGVFDEEQSFTYVLVRGPVDVCITYTEFPEIRVYLDHSGQVRYENELESASLEDETDIGLDQLFYMERIENTSVVAVPHDMDFEVTWTAAGSGTVEVYCAECAVRASGQYQGMKSEPVKVKAGDTGVALRTEDHAAKAPDGFTEQVFDARALASFIGIASLGLNWRIALSAILFVVGILLVFVIWLLVRLHRRHNTLGVPTWIFLTILCVAVLETEAAFWFFADAVEQRMIWKGVVGLALIVLFFLHFRWKEQRLRDSVFPGFLVAVFADILICKFFIPGVLVFLLAHVLLIVSFLRHSPMTKGRWIWWGLISLGGSALIIVGFAARMGLPAWASAVYVPVLLLMYNSAGGQPAPIRYASKLFALSDVLLAVFFAIAPVPAIHVIYMLLFYFSLLLMTFGDRQPENEPETLPEAPAEGPDAIFEASAEESEAIPEASAEEAAAQPEDVSEKRAKKGSSAKPKRKRLQKEKKSGKMKSKGKETV